MNIRKAERLAKRLIIVHNSSYQFQWMNSIRYFGWCRRATKTIALSKKLCRINTEVRVTETILHELAHSLTDHGHHKRFYQKCLELGTQAKRCYSSENTVIPKRNYFVYTCKGCKEEVLTRGKSRRVSSHAQCCKKFNHNQFSYEFILKLTGRRYQ